MATREDSSAGETHSGVAESAVPVPAGSVGARPAARAALAVLIVGLVVTVALAWVSLTIYNNNENRLLELRVRELSLVLSGAITSVQTPLASASELADVTGGNAEKFRSFMAAYVGPGRQFVSASLIPLRSVRPTPTTVVGVAPALLTRPTQAAHFFSRAVRSDLLSVTGILGSAQPRLGYEFNTPGAKHGFAVYAETVLPKDRHSKLASATGFADLDYAIYLGRSRPSPRTLLLTNFPHFPITGRQASRLVPFGDSAFTLVVAANTSLSSTFFKDLPWIIGGLGLVLSLAAATLADRLARRRREAEQLAAVLDRVATENRTLYVEQRGIAQTLQHALLPEALPEITGLTSSARYVPAASGIDVGGDWYDVVELGNGHAFLVVGDVSGHGLRAATTMASLRYAALAYASSDPRPASVLSRLSNFVNGQSHSYFATVLCAAIDVDGHRVTVASAGHIAPLLIEGAAGRFVQIQVGVPIGVSRDAPYTEVTSPVLPGATLLAFTDGLVERRGEVLDVGLERLREAATARPLGVDELVETLARELMSEGHDDDTAILGIRWQD